MIDWLSDWWWLLLLPALAIGLHLLAAELERRGLIYYRNPPSRGIGMAMMTYHLLFEPAVEHVIEYQRSGDLTIQTSAEPGPTPPTAEPDPKL